MATFAVQTWQVKPGRQAEFVANARSLKVILERLGVNFRSMRLYRATVAGPDTGTIELRTEYSNLASWGATVEAEYQDPEWQALAAKVGAPDAPAALISRALLTEIPM